MSGQTKDNTIGFLEGLVVFFCNSLVRTHQILVISESRGWATYELNQICAGSLRSLEIWIFRNGQPYCDDDRRLFCSDDFNLEAT
jgi:hypothetical protein